jgi:hypothetical protein
MTLQQLIKELEQMKLKYGPDVEITAWRYTGGNEELFLVEPKYSPEYTVITMEPNGSTGITN